MKLKRNILIAGLVIIVFVFIGKGFYDDFSHSCEYYCTSFRGEVKDIKYSEQKHIKVFVGERWIALSLHIKYDIKVEIGDVINKESNSYIAKLTKNGRVFDISSERNPAKYDKYCNCNKN